MLLKLELLNQIDKLSFKVDICTQNEWKVGKYFFKVVLLSMIQFIKWIRQGYISFPHRQAATS